MKWAKTESLPVKRTGRKIGLFSKEHLKALNLEGGKMVMWLKSQPEVDEVDCAISICCKMRSINKCLDFLHD